MRERGAPDDDGDDGCRGDGAGGGPTTTAPRHAGPDRRDAHQVRRQRQPVVGQQVAQVALQRVAGQRVHVRTPSESVVARSRSFASARKVELFTVPTEQPSVAAVSASDRSS